MEKYTSSFLKMLLGTLAAVFLWAALPAGPPDRPLGPTYASAADISGSADLATAIERVAKENIPAVVHIEVTERQEIPNPLLPFKDDPFFQHFFDMPKNMPKELKREVVGLGSGMIIDSKGHVLTNYHVVGGATKIKVVLANGQFYMGKDVKLIGSDKNMDVSILKLAAREPLPHVTLGDSDKVGVGQWVVAIGHPRGLDQTVTQGIVSAVHRRGISDPGTYQDFIQTDAAINPGNSGGPLINLKGEVVGVNTAIISESGGFEGIGFATPINMAAHVTKLLLTHGKVTYGWLGLSIKDLDAKLAQSLGLDTLKGAVVAEVEKKAPADIGGIRQGDVILSFDGKEIPDSASFRNDVALSDIGRRAKVNVLRDGKRQEITVVVADQGQAKTRQTGTLKRRLGLSARPVTEEETGL